MRCKRMLLWAGLLILLVGAGLLGMRWWNAPRPGLTLANVQHLHHGMSEAQAEALFGAHADLHQARVDGDLKTWRGPDFSVAVLFRRGDGTASRYIVHRDQADSVVTLDAEQVTLLRRLRRWLGL